MTIYESHYLFKLSLDKINSSTIRDLTPAEIDRYLDLAQKLFIERSLKDSTSSLVYSAAIAPLIKEEELNILDFKDNFVEASITPQDIRHIVHVLVTDSCSRTYAKNVSLEVVEQAIKDPFSLKPFYILLPSKIRVYFKRVPSKITLRYISEPPYPSLGNYTHLDGTVKPPTALALHPSSHEEVVALAVTLALTDLSSQSSLNLYQVYAKKN